VGTTTEDVARAALATIEHSRPPATLTDTLLEGTARLFVADFSNAMPILQRAAARLQTDDITRDEIARWYHLVLPLTNELGDDGTYNVWIERAEQQARADGALIVLQVVLLARAQSELRAGRFMAAEMTYNEVIEITQVVGGPPEFYEMLKCELFAWRGHDKETRAAAIPLREAAAAIGSGAAVNIADLAIATMELGAGRYAKALRAIEPMVDDNLPGWTCRALPIAVEAASRSGNGGRAAGYLSQLGARATASGTTWARGQLARGRALLANDSEAEELHIEAIRLLESTSVVTDALQAKLAYGEWLRRQNRPVDARTQLRFAHDRFSDIGAEAFAARARVEIEATGERVARRSVDARTNLTPQEEQAARLAAGGATNAEIAIQMYISANTVDYHLRKVYRKLGIASRRELRNVVPALDP
jgi:DNA-binding CsgD family transcriptional regulator